MTEQEYEKWEKRLVGAKQIKSDLCRLHEAVGHCSNNHPPYDILRHTLGMGNPGPAIEYGELLPLLAEVLQKLIYKRQIQLEKL